MKVVLQYFDDCPNWKEAAAHLDTLAAELPDLTVSLQRVDNAEEAERVNFHGSPSILVDGIDPFASDDAPVGLACRIFPTPEGPAGSPTLEQLRIAITRR